jgi:hypothetical protein
MSQVKFKTNHPWFPVEVVCGWDNPLQYYHFTIFDLRPNREDECVYSCLDQLEPFKEITTDKWKAKIKEFDIEVPEGFWERVELKESNTIHYFKDGKWYSD